MSKCYLIVQLADMGDLILSTPALAALRAAQPEAHIALLTTAHTAPVVEGTGLADEIITIERQQFNSSRAFFQPGNLRRLWRLRRGRYDAVIFFHHFTLRLGTLKFALIGLASGAKRRIGLENGNGWFLTDRLPDGGFGAKHQAEYWLELVGMVGAETAARRAVVAASPSPPAPLPSHRDFLRSQGEGSNTLSDAASRSDSFYPHPLTPSLRSGEGEQDENDFVGEESKTASGQQYGHTPRVVIHAGSGGIGRARRWFPAGFAVVADALIRELSAEIVLVGGINDDSSAVEAAMQHTPVDLTGQTTPAQLAAVLRSADVFIGAESGVMHLAAAVGTPVVAIFGPGNPDAWGPWNPGGRVTVVRSAPECSPCSYVGHGIGLREGCAARTCLHMVTPEQVTAAARAILENVTPSPPNPISLMERGGKDAQPRKLSLDNTATREAVFPRRIHILGLPVDGITYTEWLELIEGWVNIPADERRAHHVCTTNPEFMIAARSDPNFWNILQRADLCVPDGVGLLWAARRLGKPLPERVTGSDGLPIIAERAAEKSWRLYLLGAAPGVADRTAEILSERYPGLQIAGTYSGSPAREEEDAIVERVNSSSADILFVAYGAPEQDKWIARNLPRLNVAMAMGVGGAFDFIAGVVPRAPEWMRRAGLEWLHRLYLQPWRIVRMTRLPRFVLAVLLRG